MINLEHEDIHEADYEIIVRFSEAIIDKDSMAMREVLYMLDERMSGECSCLEEECICGAWL